MFGYDWREVDVDLGKRFTQIAALMIAAGFLSRTPCGAQETDAEPAAVKEERLGEVPTDALGHASDVVFSPDLRRMAVVKEIEEKSYVELDGKLGPAFDILLSSFWKYTPRFGPFSPDSKHFACSGELNGHRVVVFDGKLIEDAGEPTFSPDSKRFAYQQEKDKKIIFVVDGKPCQEFADTQMLTFSPDSKRFAYSAHSPPGMPRESWVIVDNVAGPHFSDAQLGPLVFSPDSVHIAYCSGESVILDGKTCPKFDSALTPVFSPDSTHLAYTIIQNGKWSVVLDGKLGDAFDNIYGVHFSPDSAHIAYFAKCDNAWMMVFDGKTGPALDETIRDITVGRVPEPVFSTDSKHFAYEGPRNRSYISVIDGKVMPDECRYPVFSPDSLRTACVQRLAGKRNWNLVLDGHADPEFARVFQPVFSTDSKHVAYFARGANDSCFAVLDGQRGPSYSDIPQDAVSTPLFDADGSIIYAAVKDNVAFRVTQTLSPKK